MAELKRVPLTEDTLRAVRFALQDATNGRDFDESLILAKNRQYGDSWQAEGPFVASGRMKDKIVRVAQAIALYQSNLAITQVTTAEGFQDILEMIAYGHMLMLYWIHNDLGLAGTEEEVTKRIYNYIKDELSTVGGPFADATGDSVVEDQTRDRSPY